MAQIVEELKDEKEAPGTIALDQRLESERE